VGNQPITLDLPILSQGINIDVESVAPLRNFNPSECYDVANATITALVNAPTEQVYRLVVHADVEAGTRAFARVVSATDDKFDVVANFRRITKHDEPLLQPVLAKAGIALDGQHPDAALHELAKHFKIADLAIPAGQHVVRIHLSQKLLPQAGNPKAYQLVMYVPLLSFVPSGAAKLAATVVFPLGFEQTAAIAEPVVEALPGQSLPGADAYTNGLIGLQKSFGWCWHYDPKVTINYVYN
jgi:hypothetical protein